MEAQKVHNSSFSGTFQGIEPKNVSESKCQFKNRHRLRLKKIPSHTHKTGLWQLFGVLFKILYEYPHPFFMGVSPTLPLPQPPWVLIIIIIL